MSEYWERELDKPIGTPVYKCECCGRDLCIGDEAYRIDNKWYCLECCGFYGGGENE